MNTRTSWSKFLPGVLLACAFAVPAQAQQTAEERLRDQLRKTTVELRQLQDENTDLKLKLEAATAAANAAPKQPAQDPEVAQLRKTQRSQAAQLEAARQQTEAAQQQIEAAKTALQQSQQSFGQLKAAATTTSLAAQQFEAQYQQAAGQLQACYQDNVNLVMISSVLLEKYDKKGVWDSMRDAEPLTGLHRLKLEKAVQEYRGKIIDAAVVVPVQEESAQSAPTQNNAPQPRQSQR